MSHVVDFIRRVIDSAEDECEDLVEHLTGIDSARDRVASMQELEDAFPGASEVYRTLQHIEVPVSYRDPSGEISGWRYRNIELDWEPRAVSWAWPPRTFVPYDEVLRESSASAASGARGVRVLGSCWGMSSLSHPSPGGNLLYRGEDTSVEARAEWTDDGHVRALLGATFEEVLDVLGQRGMTLRNQPGYASLSVAGCVGTGGHGSGVRASAPLGTLVTAVTIASPEPGVHEVTRFALGDSEFPRAVTHLGRLGPVVGMELAAVPAFHIAEHREIRRLGAGAAHAEQLLGDVLGVQLEASVHSAEIWIAPYADRHGDTVASVGIRRTTAEAPRGDAQRPAVLRCRLLQTLSQMAAVLVDRVHPRWIRAALRQGVLATEAKKPVVMRSRDALDFGVLNRSRVGSIEMALPMDRAAAALSALLEALEIAAQRGHYVYSPIGVRFTGAGLGGTLSPQADREVTVHVEIPTFAAPAFCADLVLPPLQALLASYGGRPHWGQRVYLSPGELRGLWPASSIAATARLVQRRDPGGHFASPLLDAVLGI